MVQYYSVVVFISPPASHTLIGTLHVVAGWAGDMLASEHGILSSMPSVLLTTLKPVPPGMTGMVRLSLQHREP